MKIKSLLLFSILLSCICSKVTLASNHAKTMENSKLLIGVNDTIVVDLKNATKTIFSIDSSYLDIPLFIKSTQPVTAIDIQFQFNQSKLVYNSITDAIPGYLSSISNYRSATDLYLVYGAYIANVNNNITPNITLTRYRFKFKTACDFQLDATDFYNPLALVNGIVSTAKFTTLNATNSPNAQFSNSPPCSNSTIQFTDLSTVGGGTITAWNWNFGNGSSSTLQNPTSTYTTTGTYTTSLVITEATGCKDTIKQILTIGSSPLSSFSYTLDCLKDSVFFTNLSTISSGTISNTLWNFGDSGSSNLVNPSHQYSSGGTYTVSLTSTSTSSCANTTTFAIVLNKPIASFVTNSINNCLGTTQNFSNTSTYSSGTITSWNWDFGDGNTSILQNPSYTYTAAGIYTVTLVSSSALGCSGTATQTITVNTIPNVQFNGNVLSGCSTQTVNFSSTSTPTTGSIYSWNFGDGTTAIVQNPTHVYSSIGTFTVKLLVTTAAGCLDSLIKPSYITIYNSPITNFSVTSGCVNSIVSFTNNSSITSGSITSWNWNFGNSQSSNLQNPVYSYTTPGTYSISLVTTSNNGCKDSLTKAVSIFPKPIVQFNASTLTGCSPLTTNFSDASTTSPGSTYLWNFGDNTISNAQNPSHTYTLSGSYTVKLYVTNSSGCLDSIVKTSFITVNPSPTANFSIANFCQGSTTSFTDNSIGIITSWSWSFGDGSTSNNQNPAHTYTNSGIYTATLSVLNSNGCSSVLTKTLAINSKPSVQFTADILTACAPQLINFTDQSTASSGSSYVWNFGDNTTSNIQNPSHTYSVAGTYTVKLIVTQLGGCSDSLVISNFITVNPSPTANFSVANFCQGSTTSFTDNSIGALTSWAWSFGDGITSNTQNPSHTYTNSGVYTVTLSVLNSNGCISIVTKTVAINSKPIVQFSADTLTACAPQLVKFTDQSTAASGSSYFWNFGDNTTSNLQNPSHTYSVVGTYTVKLIVTQPGGCSDSLVKSNFITIVSSPVALFTASSYTINLPNATATFSNTSLNYNSVLWSFGDTQSSSVNNPSHTYSAAGDYSVCLTAYNSIGCSNTYCDDILITASNIVAVPSAFTPNGDNINDVLKVRGGPFTEMEFKIFNEWGNLLFSSTSQSDGWNGKYRGDDQPTGLYEYTLKGITIENKVINLYGVVNLTR